MIVSICEAFYESSSRKYNATIGLLVQNYTKALEFHAPSAAALSFRCWSLLVSGPFAVRKTVLLTVYFLANEQS
jgi:hypothetical protein